MEDDKDFIDFLYDKFGEEFEKLGNEDEIEDENDEE